MQLLKAILNRKTTNGFFLPKPVSMKDQHTLVEAASRAPSHFNSQPWRFALIDDQEIIDQISVIGGKTMKLLMEGSFFTRYRKYFRFSKKEWLERGDGIHFDKLPAPLKPFIKKAFGPKSGFFMNKLGVSGMLGRDNEKLIKESPLLLAAMLSKEEYKKKELSGFYSLLAMGMAIENIWLTCAELGMGIQFISTPMEFPQEWKKISRIIKKPKDMELIAVYRLGYVPKSKKRPRIDWTSSYRKPLDKYVFRNTCDQPETTPTQSKLSR